MELYIAGGCSEHGRNSFLVEGEGITFLVDAGLMKEKKESPYPRLSREQIQKVDYLFLTHSHADHSGAIPWLIENGFHGTICASEATLKALPDIPEDHICLDRLAGPLEEMTISSAGHPSLQVMWGRSGHCIGSIWMRFCTEGRTLLFTGDYTEHSRAYICDRIRDMKADLAVIDCAYGLDTGDAALYRKQLDETMDGDLEKKKKILFPVPRYGRGLDLIRLLSERDALCVIEDGVLSDSVHAASSNFWLQDACKNALEKMNTIPLSAYLQDPEAVCRENQKLGILVCDSQLADERNRRLAETMLAENGSVILTGKQDPSGYAKKLYLQGQAAFCRIPVHQNTVELEFLDAENQFRTVVPYHCRQELSFDADRIKVLHIGECISI
ncbi:MAG: MBL fold metallo-hydrolase [Lachnospiraceae bacterium]|nr:MBL fold metallo-hydrolase [Lachnospiraceae bacterium]